MEALNIPFTIPPQFDGALSQYIPVNAAVPLSVSKETEGVKVMPGADSLGIQAAKTAFAGGGATVPSLTETSGASGAPATSGSGAATSGAGDYRSGDINFGSSLLGASLNPTTLIILGAVALVVVLVIAKKK